jgi:hypothetical protein
MKKLNIEKPEVEVKPNYSSTTEFLD